MVNKSFIQSLAFVLISVLALGACSVEAEDTTPCPEDYYRDGTNCVQIDGTGGNNTSVNDGGTPIDLGGGEEDAGTEEDAGVELELPLSIDEAGYVPSGYFGDGATPGAIEMTTTCPMRAADPVGDCHNVTWTPGIGMDGFAGVFWQYPANNFGELPGLVLPQGATEIRFTAWGENGGEAVEFISGLSQEVDGYSASAGVINLTATPTEYAISLCDAEYNEVVSAFGWVAANSADPVQFYIDDIVMQEAAEPCDAPSTELTLPFWMDSEEAGFVPSGFMGDDMGITMGTDCPMRAPGAMGSCHNVLWSPTPTSPGWAGVFWQYPENNWGTQPGREIEPGATAISFYAWSDSGGEVVDFGSGYATEDGFARSTGNITLTATPTQYTIDMSSVSYTEVRGGFSWSSAEAGGLNFYIDDLHWQ